MTQETPPAFHEVQDPHPGRATWTLLAALVFGAVVTWVWCGLNADRGWWITSLYSLSSCDLAQVGGLRLTLVWREHQWWRLVSTAFIHGSILHLAGNLASLWVLGPWVEDAWGHLRFAMLFLAGVMGASLASMAWVEAPVVVGASGGLMAMAGALWVARALSMPELEPISLGLLGGGILVVITLGFVVPDIAQAGHIGGLVVGGVLGWIWVAQPSRVLSIGVLGAMGAVGGALALWPPFSAEQSRLLAYDALENKEPALAVQWFEALDTPDRSPEDINATAYALALAHLRLEEAEQLALTALATDPRNSDYLDTWGVVLCERGNTRLGAAVLLHAKAISSTSSPEWDAHLAACDSTRTPE